MLERIPQQAIDHLSKLLSAVHSKNYKGEDASSISASIKRQNKQQRSEFVTHQNKHHENLSHQFKTKDTKHCNSIVQNLQEQLQKFQWAGIGFDNLQMHLISQQLKRIATRQKTSQIRFWGLIKGQRKDYYIIQARKQPVKQINPTAPGDEKNGEGANYYTYWVTSNLFSNKWKQLPNVTAAQIKAARQIKRIFTGNLQDPIQSYPQFKGTQINYLRAQISRITHGLELAPKGIYKVNDENPKIVEFEEEIKLPEFAQLATMEGWVHKNQAVLSSLGRCTHYVDPKMTQEEIQAKMTELAQKDPQIQRLRPITEDKIAEQFGIGQQSPWILKVVGDSQVFTKDDTNLVYGVATWRNVYWPGWLTIAYKNGYSNIYVGDGLKRTQNSFSIYENADLEKEGDDIEQYGEPNPKQLPKQQILPAEQAVEQQ